MFRELPQPAARFRGHADEDLPMASSEWMDLENLSRDIADSNGRLEAARAVGSFELAKVLEREIDEMERRRSRILGHIASSVVGQQPGAAKDNDHSEDPEQTAGEQKAAEEDTEAAEPEVSRSVAETDPGVNSGTETGTRNASMEGHGMVWNQLTPADVERARHELDRRRTEMLARHAEELQSLDADRTELDGLEQAISTFLRKFTAPNAGGEVVRLDHMKQPRAQAGD
jgi:hypothetical protein